MNEQAITIWNAKDHTAQEVFDFVVSGVLQQGKGAIDDSGSCRLRTPDGRKCAMGFLVPDEMYSPSLENYDRLCEMEQETQKHAGLVYNLRTEHDRSALPNLTSGKDFVTRFSDRARCIAELYSLSPAVIDNFLSSEDKT